MFLLICGSSCLKLVCLHVLLRENHFIPQYINHEKPCNSSIDILAPLFFTFSVSAKNGDSHHNPLHVSQTSKEAGKEYTKKTKNRCQVPLKDLAICAYPRLQRTYGGEYKCRGTFTISWPDFLLSFISKRDIWGVNLVSPYLRSGVSLASTTWSSCNIFGKQYYVWLVRK